MIEVIQPLLAPAVMFSAGGLLCLAQFARFTAVIGLVRTFNLERLSALQEADRAEPKLRELLLQRVQGLEHQASIVLSSRQTRQLESCAEAPDASTSGCPEAQKVKVQYP